jgi:hypothetical protein
MASSIISIRNGSVKYRKWQWRGMKMKRKTSATGAARSGGKALALSRSALAYQ